MTNPTTNRSEGPYAMWVILAGLGAMTVVTIAALVRYPNPTAIVTALGPVTGVIGTLVGAYFGLRGSSLAQQNANAAELERTRARNPDPPPTNGHGNPAAIAPLTEPVANPEALRREQLAAVDAPSDAGDVDVDLPDIVRNV